MNDVIVDYPIDIVHYVEKKGRNLFKKEKINLAGKLKTK